MWETILGILASALALMLWWLKEQADRNKKAIFEKLSELEGQYREALFAKDPIRAAKIAKEMGDLREKYSFLKGAK